MNEKLSNEKRGPAEPGQPVIFGALIAKDDLIVDPVLDWDRVPVRHSIDALSTIGYDLGIPPWWLRIEGAIMVLKRVDLHAVAARTMLKDMRNPSLQRYPDPSMGEDLASIGLTQRDVAKVVSWMQSQGLESLEVSPARTSVTFSGNLLLVEAAFGTEFHRYRFKGKEYLGNACELTIPAALAPVVSGILNLSTQVLKPQRPDARN